MKKHLKTALITGASAMALSSAAFADEFDVPGGDLKTALNAFAMQARVALIVSGETVKGVRTRGVHGNLPADVALARILNGTGLTSQRTASGEIGVVPVKSLPHDQHSDAEAAPIRLAAASAAASSVETVVVTSSKIKGDIQTVPIAITALSQEQLTSRQIAGGPDLVKEVPNLTFSKTNFSGYTIQIRGIGTQAISVTTDPAVAVALNDTPFIRNHFFEQEFFDVNQVEVLRGPQGTLYGRNATAGVVNVVSAKPTDQFEAMLSVDWGNYTNRRYEGMVNIPIVDDRLDLRVAGEWTKRDGYSTNALTGKSIDGRDLWSSRVTLGWHPLQGLQTYLVWEHFSEDDDRLRSAKQLCKTTPLPLSIDGVPVPQINPQSIAIVGGDVAGFLAQGCAPVSLYSPESFEVPNGYTLPYYAGLSYSGKVTSVNPYLNATQSRNLRVIESQIEPTYKVRSDVVELNSDYELSPALTLSSTSGFNEDFVWSTEDYNRFQAAPGVFPHNAGDGTLVDAQGVFCDPQLGCSNKILAEDLVTAHSWQASQEFRLTSHFSGPLNFAAGGNYQHYETDEDYYVFINSLTLYAARNDWDPGVSDNSSCMYQEGGFVLQDPTKGGGTPSGGGCIYIDPNPIGHLNGNGHNYFRSQNPYVLNSYAAFGEAYYDFTNELKLITGLRWTDDEKHFTDIPSELIADGWGYGSTGKVDQKWDELTGRAALNWSPKLAFTDQTLFYGSYAHGYKAGGANPPGAVLLTQIAGAENPNPVHPLTFKPEFVDAFELGTKNTLADGALTLNGDVFYYDYKGYQISEIVDRTSINSNFNATVRGAEVEAAWEPIPGLKFNFNGGYEDARADNGQSAIDLMDRADTADHPDWMVVKPFLTQASNCVFPVWEVAEIVKFANILNSIGTFEPNPTTEVCGVAYYEGFDPITDRQYTANPSGTTNYIGNPAFPAGYTGYNPATAPNDGEGWAKDLSGNQLPNAPHFTTSLSADYTLPVSENWAATLHSDFYWQSQSWARIFNDNPYDKLRGYSNVNVALTLTSASGWQVMGYVKNVFNVTAITGDFLNSDDSGLTTNVFLTDPRLYGVRITKNW